MTAEKVEKGVVRRVKVSVRMCAVAFSRPEHRVWGAAGLEVRLEERFGQAVVLQKDQSAD